MYDFPVPDCTQEQNGSPQFSSIVRQCKWPSMSRTIVEIQKFCYHGNLTSRFSLFLWVSLSFMMWTSFFPDRQEAVGMRDNPSLCTLARQIFWIWLFRHFKYRNHFCVHHATDLFCPKTITNWTIDVILRELKPILCLSASFRFVLWCIVNER